MTNSIAPLENINTRIWEKICETDPARTKKIEGGKFRGTSINPNYIYEKLTSVFGPCGVGWGFEVAEEVYKPGHELNVSHSYRINFWHNNNGIKSEMIPAVGCTDYVFKDKNGWHTDGDAPKKSMTDALTKASQLIGMSADIFGGQWDDCKYVAELKRKYAEQEKVDGNPEKPEPVKTEPKNDDKPPAAKPSAKTTEREKSEKKITKPQAGLLFHKFKDAGFTDADMKEYVSHLYNVETIYSLPMSAVKDILALYDNSELIILAKKNDPDMGIADVRATPPDDFPIDPLFPKNASDLIDEKQFEELLSTQKYLKIRTFDMMVFIKENGFNDPTEITQEKFSVIMKGLSDLSNRKKI